MKDENELENLLLEAKEVYKNDEEALARRLEWIVLLCEEKYKDELEKEKTIYNLISFLLVATSFLASGFVVFLVAFLDNSLHKITQSASIFTMFTGILLVIPIGLELFMLLYRKRRRLESVLSTATTLLRKTTSFDNKYSENYGRVLLLNDYIVSIEKNNKWLSFFEIITVGFISLFLIFFFICFLIF